MQQRRVHELRLVVTTDDYEKALHFYRDVLGLRERASFTSEGGHVSILEAGEATLNWQTYVTQSLLTRLKLACVLPDTDDSLW